MSDHVYDCVIIGAGLSGLSAACYLQAHGVADFLVLEARQRVGGRSYTVSTADHHAVDLGAAHVGPTQNRILRVLHDYNISTTRVHTLGSTVSVLRSGRHVHSGSVPGLLSPFTLLDVNHSFRVTEQQRRQLQLASSSSLRQRLEQMTMRQWVEEQCDTEQGRELYSAVVRSLCCVEPSEISALCWLQSVDASGGTARMLEVEGGAQERTIAGGSQQISERMRDTVGTQRVLLNTAVSIIDWDESRTAAGVTEAQDIAAGIDTRSLSVSASSPPIRVRCRDGCSYYSRRVIVALSPALYDSIRFQPYLPSWKQQPTSRMHMGSVIKTVMRYQRSWWRDKGYCGAMFDTTGDVLVSAFDDCSDAAASSSSSSSSSPFYALVGFSVASSARHWQQRSPAQRQQAVAAQYQRVFQSDAALHPVSYTECDWAAEEYSRGGYSAVSPPLVITALDEALRAPTAGIHYAGSETAATWTGYLDGAVEAGERAAHEVLQALNVPGLSSWQPEEAEGADWECRAGSQQSQLHWLYLPRASTAYWTAVITTAAVASAVLFRAARFRL